MTDLIEQVLVPMEEVIEVRRGAKVSSERKFFPGYVLVKMDMTDDTWHLVKNTPKVTGFLGGRGRPTPISDAEAERIMRQVQEGVDRPKPSVVFETGEQVRVCDGPFTSFNGLRGRGGRGAGALEGGGVDLRAIDAGGVGVLPGGEALTDSGRQPESSAGGWPQRPAGDE
jgi:hypothetical protein